MSELDISFKVKNYKCFRDEFVGFDKIKPVNIIIGRNNSGKSSMLDILEFLTDPKLFKDAVGKDNIIFQIEDEIYEEELKSVFKPGTYGGKLSGNDFWNDHGCKLLGLRVSYEIKENNSPSNYQWLSPEIFENGLKLGNLDLKHRKIYMDKFFTEKCKYRIPKFFKDKIIRRLSSDRDIVDEGIGRTKELKLESNGKGATNIIYNLLSNTDIKNRGSVKKELLEALNKIFNPDNDFVQITTPSPSHNMSEVYLEEHGKGDIPLSKSGSGLKTVILVLLNMLVMPSYKQEAIVSNISDYLFAFEELENNLHPALLRRLFKYIEDFAIKNKCRFFITTHSNVVIDQFSQSPNAQIIHIVHDGIKAHATTINSFKEHSAVLDDLGAKASDLLQANGIIWLEGPSDRTYFNKWIELYSDNKLKEHRDYECAFYGGSLLAHFESDDSRDVNVDAVNILRVNRNAILIGDSDKTASDKPLKPRLEKMKTAMEKMEAYTWVTDAKEIENYIPATVLNKIFKKDNLPEIGRYERFHRAPTETDKTTGYWQENNLLGSFDKVDLAHNVVPHLLKEDLNQRFELKDKMAEICKIIEKWNQDRPK